MIIRVPEEEKSNLFLLLHRSKCDLTFSLGLLDGKSYLLFVEGRLNALMCKRIMHLPNCQLTESLLIILSCLLYLSIVLEQCRTTVAITDFQFLMFCWFVSSSSVFLFLTVFCFFAFFFPYLLCISLAGEFIKYTTRRTFNIIEISTLVRSRIVYILSLGLFKF